MFANGVSATKRLNPATGPSHAVKGYITRPNSGAVALYARFAPPPTAKIALLKNGLLPCNN